MSLQEKLDEFKTGALSRLKPEDVAVMEAATEELVRSGMVKGVKKVGDRTPDFTLPNASGEMVKLSALLAKGPVVLTFYRGTWRPYCNLQLQAYQDILPDIKALGANLVAISPQTPKHSLTMAGKHHIGFEVVSDLGNRVARQFGLVFALGDPLRKLYKEKFGVDLKEFNADESHELPMLGTFIISPDGTVQYAFVDPDYTTRSEPKEIIKRLREISREIR